MRFSMEQHEREYFISRIRSGIYRIDIFGKRATVIMPTIEQEFDINQAYQDCYNESLDSGVKTQKEMHQWIMDRGLWTAEEELKIETIKKDIEKLKLEIYKALNDQRKKDAIRLYLRAAEKELNKCYQKKEKYFINTCEGLASIEKIHEFIKLCTYIDGKPCDFNEHSLEHISNLYYSQILKENQIRELARTDPWKTSWVLHQSNSIKLFAHNDRELSIDQKNILIWSKMYDNVHESLDSPPDFVLEDDDMLDGWFIMQRQKREEEKKENNLDNSLNPKVAAKEEIFLMARDKQDAKRINDMNSTTAKMIKIQRQKVINQKGEAGQLDFKDERIKISEQSNKQFKGKFRR